MKTIDLNKVSFLLKKTTFSFNYCHPERIKESDMNPFISQIENSLSEMNESEIIEIINSIDTRFFDGENEEVFVKTFANEIAYHVVKGMKWQTVTFIVNF